MSALCPTNRTEARKTGNGFLSTSRAQLWPGGTLVGSQNSLLALCRMTAEHNHLITVGSAGSESAAQVLVKVGLETTAQMMLDHEMRLKKV